MCEGIVARIEKSVAGISSCDEISAEVAGCIRAAQGQEMAWKHAKPESENERAIAGLAIAHVVEAEVYRYRLKFHE